MSAPQPQITRRFTWPDDPPGPDCAALDGEKAVGRVYQGPHGPQKGLWLWTMTVSPPGPRVPGWTSSVERSAGMQAGAWSRLTMPD